MRVSRSNACAAGSMVTDGYDILVVRFVFMGLVRN